MCYAPRSNHESGFIMSVVWCIYLALCRKVSMKIFEYALFEYLRSNVGIGIEICVYCETSNCWMYKEGFVSCFFYNFTILMLKIHE